MERLTGESILSGNSADSVKTRLNLPLETGTGYWRDMNIGDCQISWQSSNPDVIDVDGRVNRPANGQDEVSVTLTATISYVEASDSKTFDFVVTPIEEYPLAISYDGFSNTSLLQFNNVSNTVDSKDRDGKDIKALQFNNDRGVDEGAGGSVFTKNKIRLSEDLSFSTAFSYRNPHPDYTLGEGGFTFTLQAVGNTVYSQQLNDESMNPSISIAFITDYHKSSGSGQGDYYGYTDEVTVYYNGDYENRIEQEGYLTAGATNDPSPYSNVWIEYNGVAETLEIRFSTDGLRPTNSNFKIENLNLAEVLMSADDGLGTEDVRELYAGFMGSMGNGKDKSEIGSWHFKNDFTPIDFEAYNFIDLSNIKLTANPPAGSVSSTITALISSLDETPVEGIPVDFTSSFGILESSSATTDAFGEAFVNLRSDITGTASVKVIAPGGATALTEVQFAVSDEDGFHFDCAWLTEERILGVNTSPGNITAKLNLPEEAPNGSIISWECDVTGVIALDGTVTRPTFTEQNKKVRLTATINKGDYREIRIFDVIVKALDATDLEAVSLTEDWLTYDKILGGNAYADQVEEPLSLAVTGLEGTAINWSCSPEGIVSVNPDTMGQLKPPSVIAGDALVSLVATIVRGDVVREKTFVVTVKAPTLTDEEAVALDYNRLKIADTLGVNPSPYAVTANLIFSNASLYGSEITYTSSAPDVLSLSPGGEEDTVGEVNRPGYEDSHQAVTVTVTITKGSQQKVKEFGYTVLALRDITPPVPVTITPAHNSMDVAYNTKETVITFNEDIMPKDGTNFYGYWPKYMGITLNGSLMPDDYIVRFEGKKLIIINRAGVMPTGKNQIFIPAGTVKDKSGNSMADDINITYTVEERVVRNIGLASSIPANGAVNVSVGTEISFTFDTSGLTQGSNFNKIALMNEQYPSIPIQCELKDDKVTVSFKYADWSLQKGQVYMLFIPGGAVKDRFLNQNEMQLLSFVVSPETPVPTIASTFPEQNAADVSVLQHIQIHFKEAVIRSGGQVRITDATGQPVAFAVSELRNFDTILDLIPLEPLSPNTRYTVVLSADFVKTKIAPHEPATSDYTLTFITGDNRLSIQGMNPVNFAWDVPVNDPIHLVFNQPVQKGPQSNSLSMTDSAGNKVGAFAGYNGNTVEIKPLSIWLEPNEAYTLSIPAGVIADKAGNLNDSLTVTFTTGMRLDLSNENSFTVHPTPRYLVNKKITFDTAGLQETFRKTGRKLVSCQWNFGDGQTASGLQADHIYTLAGNYTAKLKATDNKGIEYELTQPMSIRSLKIENIEMVVTPEKLQNLIREDEYIDPLDGYPGRRLYTVYIKNEGVYLPN
ncbi:MAG: immunoglobulin-like domain-containing protein, partial [Anaerovoracaceae bacterium]